MSDKKPPTQQQLEEERQQAEIKTKCEAWAHKRFGKEQIVKWSNEHKGLWYVPIIHDGEDEIDKCAIFRRPNRTEMDYAGTKLADGFNLYITTLMRQCFIDGDMELIDDDEYYFAASAAFNQIVQVKKAFLLKR